MTASKTQYGTPLTGLPAFLAGLPRAATPRGGVESGFDGTNKEPSSSGPPTEDEAEPQDFTGMGPWLEADDKTLFDTLHNLVLRQELLARNHLAQDTYWTYVKIGYPWAILERPVDNKNAWVCTLPDGVSKLTVQAVPNQAWDLINKAAETLLVDLPKPDPTAVNDSERAERAADLAEQFLDQYGGEDGLSTPDLAFQALDAALVRASAYAHYWVDETGGGYIPLQIEAHPQATDPEHPEIGPDGMPTTDLVLRYLTEPMENPEEPDGEPKPQFTDDPSQAAKQWVPQIKADVWGREHIRVFPETADVASADKIIGLWYCTLSEAKLRWPKTVGALSPGDLGALCDWTPVRYLALLPPQLRARWQITTGSLDEQQGSPDERIMFYYVGYQRPRPHTKEGAAVYVTGALGGFVLDKDTLGMQVLVPSEDGKGEQYERRCMDIPVNELRPRIDADDRDPSGRAFIEMFGGATEFNMTLAASYLEALDVTLHLEKYTAVTSPVQGFQIEESRSTGNAIPVLSMTDRPQYGQAPPVPGNMLDVMNWGQEQVQNIASLTKPLQGSDQQQEVSGKARNIAVQQALVGLSRMQQAVNSWFGRHYRFMLQLAQKHFAAPIMVRYTGNDQSYEVQWFNAEDFALVGDVQIKPGSGTMMTPDAKVNYVLPLLQQGVIEKDAALDLIKPAYAKVLGNRPSPQETRVERCISKWLKGPPQGWVEQVQQMPMQQQQYQQAAQMAQARGLPAPPQPPPPFNPFTDRPNDTEPAVAEIWRRRLSDVQSTVAYTRQPPEWRQVLDAKYTASRNIVAQAAQPPAAAPSTDDQSFQQFVQGIDASTLAMIKSAIAKMAANQAMGQPQAPPKPQSGSPPQLGVMR